MMARILILHASVGAGHKTAARALEKAFRLRRVEHVWTKDSLEYGLKLFQELYTGSYLELSEKAPALWAYFYERSDKNETELTKALRTLVDRLGVTELKEMVQHYRPDAIICTHFLPLNLLAREKRKGRLEAMLYCVVTDYTGHVYWVDPIVDGYFVATPETGEMLIRRGVPQESVTVTGIPVDPAIAQPKDPAQLRETYQLTKTPVMTLMGGGLNIDRVEQIVSGLLERSLGGTLLVVAGRNEKLQKAMEKLPLSVSLELRALGFINHLDDLVAASDLVITKAGGLIVSEVMARQTPMVVIDPIPGQEEWNADYVVSVGAGVQIRLPEMVPLAVHYLLTSPERLEALRLGASRAGRPQAAMAVADAILKVVG
jgi:processive 1,2-diacylglycerol beta-glucosyltransferase